MTKRQFIEAYFYRLALLLGLENAQSVVVWADAILLGDGNLDKDIIDISLAGDQSANLIHLLGELTVQAPLDANVTAFGMLASLILQRLEEHTVTTNKVSKLLYDLLRSGEPLPPAWAEFADWLDDELTLGRLREADKALRDFLSEESEAVTDD